MPLLHVAGRGAFVVSKGERLVRVLESNGLDIGHRCGGKARCTTCRVRFVEGEPGVMTRAEYEKLSERGLLGSVRLSCQIVVEEDMHVEPLQLVSEMGWSDPGPAPAPVVEPEPEWMERPA